LRIGAALLEPIMDLNQASVPAHDLEAAVAFYRLLGLRLIVKNEHYARFELPKGEATLSIARIAEPIGPGASTHLYFECDNLDAEVARLKGAGVVFDRAPVDQAWLWREAWLKDPAGNWLCLYHAGQNRRHPPWRIP
jgi:catechol 2,3-dioxygenase-like lactoylglutathione lyase family enzyme